MFIFERIVNVYSKSVK